MLSQVIYGAAILYNLMLAEVKASSELIDSRRADAENWLSTLDRANLSMWSLDWVLPLALDHQQLVSPHTLGFCKQW